MRKTAFDVGAVRKRIVLTVAEPEVQSRSGELMTSARVSKAHNDHNVYILGTGFAAEAALPMINHPARMPATESEGIAPQVRNFVRQAEQERGREKGKGVERDEGLER